MEKAKYPPHAIVEKLGETPAVKLLGYFGSTSAGVVKVYADLDDLSSYFEVNEADILHVEEAPEEVLPHGGSAIWVKGDATITQCVNVRSSVQASFLGGVIAAQMSGGPAFAARAAPIEPDTANCNGFSVWPCSVIWGACLPSNDDPCQNTKQFGCQILSANSCIGTCAGFTCVAECATHNPNCPPQPTQFCTNNLRLTHCCPVLTRVVNCQVLTRINCQVK
jgi:hypothetical protein